MAQDISSRINLLEAVIAIVEQPRDQGGIGLPVVDLDIPRSKVDGLGAYYPFAIYDQILSRELGFSSHPIDRLAFSQVSPEVVQLGSHYAIRTPDKDLQQTAIDFLLSAQHDLASLPEIGRAVTEFRSAEISTIELKHHVDRLDLTPGFPLGSSCDLCKKFL